MKSILVVREWLGRKRFESWEKREEENARKKSKGRSQFERTKRSMDSLTTVGYLLEGLKGCKTFWHFCSVIRGLVFFQARPFQFHSADHFQYQCCGMQRDLLAKLVAWGLTYLFVKPR